MKLNTAAPLAAAIAGAALSYRATQAKRDEGTESVATSARKATVEAGMHGLGASFATATLLGLSSVAPLLAPPVGAAAALATLVARKRLDLGTAAAAGLGVLLALATPPLAAASVAHILGCFLVANAARWAGFLSHPELNDVETRTLAPEYEAFARWRKPADALTALLKPPAESTEAEERPDHGPPLLTPRAD
jgi:hypothetical protein